VADVKSNVAIKVTIDSDGVAAGLAEIERRLKLLEDRSDRIGGKGNKSIARNFDRIGDSMKKLKKPLMDVIGGFGKMFAVLTKVNFIALAAEMAVFTAGLLAIKLALLTGRAAAKLWNIAMKGVSVAAASVATAVSVAAAAMREFQEAQLTPFMGGGAIGRQGARRISRGMGVRNMGLLGGQGAQQVAAAQAKGGFSGVNSASFISALINASGGADPAAIAAVLSQTTVSGARTAMSNLAGVNQGALSGATTFGGLAGALPGATKAGFGGTGEMLGNTFLGTVKTGFADMKGLFADIGAPMLGPMRDAFLQINQIMRENFMVLQSIIQRFGADSMAPTMVTIFDRMMKWITSNVINHLDNIKEMGKNFVKFFSDVKNFFVVIGDWLKQYEPAANVIIDMFKAASNANNSSLFKDFSKMLTENREGMKNFGAAVGRMFGGIFDLFAGGNRGFFNQLPNIVKTLDTITTKLIPAIQDLWNRITPIFERLPDIIESVASAINAVAPFIAMLANAISQVVGVLAKLGPILGLMLLSKVPGIGGMIGGVGRVVGAGLGKGAAALAAKTLPGMGAPLASGVAGPTMTYGMVGARLGMLGAYVGGATMAVKGGMEAYDTGRFTGKMALGAGLMGVGGAGLAGVAMTGAALMPIVAPLVITAIAVEGILAYFGNKKFKADSRKAMEEALESRQKARDQKFDSNTFGQESVDSLLQEQKLLEAAIGAGFNDKGEWKGEGDTAEMRAYLRFIGKDPNSVHRDESLQTLMDEGAMEDIVADLERAENNYRTNLGSITNSLNDSLSSMGLAMTVTTEEAEKLAKELYNIDLYTQGTRGAGMMLAAHLTQFDRNTAFSPNFQGSQLSLNESMLSADAALNALAGDFNMQNLTAFTTAFSSYEANRGMSTDLVGLSSVLELEQQANAGAFGVNKAAALDAASTARAQIFADMGAQYNIPSTKLQEIYASGGLGGIENYLTRTQNMRAAIAGTDSSLSSRDRISTLSQGSGIDLMQDEDFLKSVGGALSASDVGLGQDRGIFGQLGYEGRLNMALDAAEGGNAEAAEAVRVAMNNWLLEQDDSDGKRNQFLDRIANATENPVFSINGTETGSGEITITLGGNETPGGRPMDGTG